MKLITVEITEFQSIRNSNPFGIGDITCLVGKNEAGKTALLQALYRLNPINPTDSKYDVTDDYPRENVEDYQQEVEKGTRKPAIVAKAKFILGNKELEQIEKDWGKNLLVTPELILSKGYENLLAVNMQINERAGVEHIIKHAQLPTRLRNEVLKDVENIQDLISKINGLVGPEVTANVDQLKIVLSQVQQAGSLKKLIYKNYLESFVPKFLYFDEYYQMKGQENLDSLKIRMANGQLEKADYPLLGLIDLARLKIDELFNPQRTEWLINKLEGAGNYLSGKILKYWSQNKYLQMKFDVRPARPGDPQGMTAGTNLWARVYDSKHFVTTPLGSRSRGFVWFFSFLAWFDQQQRKNQNLILLLDEPGLFLHGKAQEDLLRYLDEELKDNHQVIYTTHSPFMVDPRHFDRVRIVQDKSSDSGNDKELPKEDEGTKVLTDVLEATDDSLFPLQGALGYQLHQTLFIGPNSLVVEGVSDLLYLQTMSGVLESLGREGLSSRWTIVPVGGSEKVPTFVALLGAQKGMKIATLIDIQKKDQQTIENLYKRKLLTKKNVLTFSDFTGKPEADIEDMFSPEFYLRLVNSEYKLESSESVSEKDIKGNSPRILVRLEYLLNAKALSHDQIFSHYRPARYFSENIGNLQPMISEESLGHFENAFKELNKLL